jgi:hypothetical protein
MKRPRALGNSREDKVIAAFQAMGRKAIAARGSGSRGKAQASTASGLSGDVFVLPESGYSSDFPGLVLEIGSHASTNLELEKLRAGCPRGWFVGLVQYKRKGRATIIRWLLGDVDGGYTECEGALDMHETVLVRFDAGQVS